MRTWFFAWVAICSAGCASTQMNDARAMRGIERAENSVGAPHNPTSTADTDAAALIINGTPYAWADIIPALAEAGGTEIVRELMLDTALREECQRRRITITQSDIDAERDRFMQIASVSGDADGRSLDAIRRARGLGPVRFAALLQRTARLRALVRDQVVISDAALASAYRLRYGTRYDIRVIVTRSAAEAQAAVMAIRAGSTFADTAIKNSIDASAPSGGFIPAVSPDDLAWPQAIRSALTEVPLGGIRGPIVLENTWALITIERIIPPPSDAPTIEAARPELEPAVRLAQERTLMEAESRRLLAAVTVKADNTLRWAVETAR